MLGNVFAKVVSAAASVVTKAQPYEIKEQVHGYRGSLWTLHKGIAKESGKTVSILAFNFKENPSERQLGAIRNAAKRMKTLRHPGVVAFVDSYETDTTVYVVIEEVRPLIEVLEEYRTMDVREREANIALGLYQLAKAVGFLNRDCKPALVHGNLSPSSIFVNRAGEWRLAGFELVCEHAEVDVSYRGMHGLLDNRYKPPEVTREQWGALARAPAWAVDAYALGCIIYEAFNGPFSNPDELSSSTRIPQELAGHYKKLVSGTPATRPCTADITSSTFFNQPAVQVNEFLDSIAIRDEAEKEAFFKELPATAERLPKAACLYKLLPSLISAMEMMGPGGARVLPSVLKIAGQLPSSEFEGLMAAHLAKWFASADRGIRMALLQGLPDYIQHCTMSLVNDKIFPQVCNGFSDQFPQLREATVKSLLHLGPKLPVRTLHQAVLKYFGKLQIDPEPGIRTNTTICLGRLAKYFTEASHQRILVPAFTRTLRDPFAPARNAALLSLAATADVLTRDECATKVVPAVAPLCIDPEADVRTSALACLQTVAKKLEAFVEEMNKESAEAAAAQARADAKAPSAAAAAGPASPLRPHRSAPLTPAGLAQVGGGGVADDVGGRLAGAAPPRRRPPPLAPVLRPRPAPATSTTSSSSFSSAERARPSRLEAAAAAAAGEAKAERKGGMRLGLGAVKAGGASGSGSSGSLPKPSEASPPPRPAATPASSSSSSSLKLAAAAADADGWGGDAEGAGWDADPWAAAPSPSAKSPGAKSSSFKSSNAGAPADDDDDPSAWGSFEEPLEVEQPPPKPAAASSRLAAAAAAAAASEPPASRPVTTGMLLSSAKPAAPAPAPAPSLPAGASLAAAAPKLPTATAALSSLAAKPSAVPTPAPIAAASAARPLTTKTQVGVGSAAAAPRKPKEDDWESLLK
eukprot:tig00000601_g2294.t1